jgi:protein arginine kinase
MTKWLNTPGIDEDVVVSTRIRVARNIDKYKFPNLIEDEEAREVTNDILNALKDVEGNYEFYRNSNLGETERNVFVEKHLISPNLSRDTEHGSFFVKDDEKATIMINEEDHIRIQVLLPGLNIEEGWKRCSSIDDEIEKSIKYAFDEKFGYLTSCPTNVGTGLRASVMLHLPGLSMTGQINNIMEGLRKIGLTVRGLYGEGSKALGNLFQISNQTTIGEKEEDIIKKINKIILQIVTRERNTRKYILDNKGMEIEDKIYRSLGILNYSRVITTLEAMNHLSNVKFGTDMGIIKNINSKDIIKLMLDIQPASIKSNQIEDIDIRQVDILRGTTLREKLKNLEG